MSLHYFCFIFFLSATIAFFIGDIIDPPPKSLNVHLGLEIVKIVSSVILQVSLGVVLYMLII
jgi:hypothetical protein